MIDTNSPPPPADTPFRSIDDYLDSPDSADIRTGIMMKMALLWQSPYNIKITIDPFANDDVQMTLPSGQMWKEHLALRALHLKRQVGILREWLHSEFDEHPEMGMLEDTVIEWRATP